MAVLDFAVLLMMRLSADRRLGSIPGIKRLQIGPPSQAGTADSASQNGQFPPHVRRATDGPLSHGTPKSALVGCTVVPVGAVSVAIVEPSPLITAF